MHLQVRGDDLPKDLLDVIGAITDHAKLRCREVEWQKDKHVVVLPITRLPLRQLRKVMGNLHDTEHPRRATVTIRRVTSCAIHDKMNDTLEGEVELLFGLVASGHDITLSSAEEDHGEPCYLL